MAIKLVENDLRSMDGQDVVYSTTLEGMPNTLFTEEGWHEMSPPAFKDIRPPPLQSQLFTTEPQNAVSYCDNVRVFLENSGIRFGPEAVEESVNKGSEGVWGASIHTVSLPLISTDGNDAIYYWESDSECEAGSGFYHLAKRTDTGWMVVTKKSLWIS